jgi:hypothetical protein
VGVRADLDVQARATGGDGDGLIAQLPGKVKRRARRLLLGQA